MNKVSQYLQEHLTGEVLSDNSTRQLYSHDKSILELLPMSVIWPRDESDVRKLVRFVWQLAERGRILPVTARGSGYGENGGAISSGLVVDFSKHLNRVLVLDPKKHKVSVEAGINAANLNQTLFTHGLYLSNFDIWPSSSIGGVFASSQAYDNGGRNNAMTSKVTNLRAVLSNGEVIEAHRISKKELSVKMGQSNFEGEIYRQLDALFDEHAEAIDYTARRFAGSINSTGYNVYNVKGKDGSFDISALLAGSEGTLALITEATANLDTYNQDSKLIMASFESLEDFSDCLKFVADLNPSKVFYVSDGLVNKINQYFPNYLSKSLPEANCMFHMIVEFNEEKDGIQKKKAKKLKDKLSGVGAYCSEAKTFEDKQEFSKLIFAPQLLDSITEITRKALPTAGGISVPLSKVANVISEINDAVKTLNQSTLIWGHGSVIYCKPFFDVSTVGDRQKIFKLMDEVFGSALHHGGSYSAHGDGRMRAPYVAQTYPADIIELFTKIKNIFDPHGILNPGVKLGVTAAQSKALLKKSN